MLFKEIVDDSWMNWQTDDNNGQWVITIAHLEPSAENKIKKKKSIEDSACTFRTFTMSKKDWQNREQGVLSSLVISPDKMLLVFFQSKSIDIFLVSAWKHLLCRGTSNEYPQPMFLCRNKKKYFPDTHSYLDLSPMAYSQPILSFGLGMSDYFRFRTNMVYQNSFSGYFLALTMLWADSVTWSNFSFFFFSKKIRFGISCKLSPRRQFA